MTNRRDLFSEHGSPADFTLSFRGFTVDQNERAWFITKNKLLFFNPFSADDYILYDFPPSVKKIHSILDYSSDSLLLLVDNHHLLFFNKKTRKFTDRKIRIVDLEDRTTVSPLRKIFLTDNNMLWLEKENEGLYYTNLTQRGFSLPFTLHDIPSFAVHRLTENPDGSVLCTSDTGRAVRVEEDLQDVQKENMSAYPRVLHTPQGERFVISSAGLSVTEDGADKLLLPADNNLSIYSDFIAYDSTALLLATNRGLLFYQKESGKLLPSGFTEWFFKIFRDSKNRLWAADVYDNLLVLKVADDRPDSLLVLKHFPNFGLINDFKEDPQRNCIWIGTSKGLVKADGETLQNTYITEADGLPNQYIQGVAVRAGGDLWLSSNRGLIHYRPESDFFSQYIARDGLSGDEYSPGAALVGQDGRLWFGSTKGVDVFHPDSIKVVGTAPKLAINSLHIHGEPWQSDSVVINYRDEIELPYTQNTLTFDLAALEYTDPARNAFKTWLTYNGKTDSTALGTQNSVTYTNLAPGAYLFEFTACNAEKIWQKNKRGLKIIITPPYYQTWWFRALIFLAVGGLISFISSLYYRYRLRAKELELEKEKRRAEKEQLRLAGELKMQRERNRIADELHDDMGGKLSTILFAGKRMQRAADLKDAQSLMQKVSKISLELIESMRGIIWAMDTDNDTLANLLATIRNYAGRLAADNNIALTLDFPAEYPTVTVSGAFRHNVLLTVKELLHNALKHSGSRNLKITVKLSDTRMRIAIRDFGCGFSLTDGAGKGKGLNSMRRRIEATGGKIEWQLKNPGTKAIISVPFLQQQTSHRSE